MSIASELQNYEDGLGDAYDAAQTMGAVMPAQKNMNNLDATILTIPQPTVNDGTLTIQQNGTTLGTFTANQASNTTVNITGGGGSNVTVFYGYIVAGTNKHFYSDQAMTTAITGQDFSDAIDDPDQIVVIYDVDGDYQHVVVVGEGWTAYVVGASGEETYRLDAQSAASTDFTVTKTDFQEKLTAGSNITISSNTISATDTTYSDFVGATSSVAGSAGLVPAPAAGDETKVLYGDGTWTSLAAVATSGDYNDLYNAPVVPTNTLLLLESNGTMITAGSSALNADEICYYVQGGEVTFYVVDSDPNAPDVRCQLLQYIQDQANGTFYFYIGDPDSGVVKQIYYSSNVTTTCVTTDIHFATTSDINNATLTIQHNGTNVQTFTANASTNATANIQTIYSVDAIDTTAVTPTVTADMIDWTTLNVLIDTAPTASTFFGGAYTHVFTAPVAGYYEINTPFSCLCHRTANALNTLTLSVDSTSFAIYTYASEAGDTEWGMSRRTITSASPVTVHLSAGTHTLTTSGDLYYDSAMSSNSFIGTITAKLVQAD